MSGLTVQSLEYNSKNPSNNCCYCIGQIIDGSLDKNICNISNNEN